jgi:hypothetical protein
VKGDWVDFWKSGRLRHWLLTDREKSSKTGLDARLGRRQDGFQRLDLTRHPLRNRQNGCDLSSLQDAFDCGDRVVSL